MCKSLRICSLRLGIVGRTLSSRRSCVSLRLFSFFLSWYRLWLSWCRKSEFRTTILTLVMSLWRAMWRRVSCWTVVRQKWKICWENESVSGMRSWNPVTADFRRNARALLRDLPFVVIDYFPCVCVLSSLLVWDSRHATSSRLKTLRRFKSHIICRTQCNVCICHNFVHFLKNLFHANFFL